MRNLNGPDCGVRVPVVAIANPALESRARIAFDGQLELGLRHAASERLEAGPKEERCVVLTVVVAVLLLGAKKCVCCPKASHSRNAYRNIALAHGHDSTGDETSGEVVLVELGK